MNQIYFITVVILVLACSSKKNETTNSKSKTKKDSNYYYKNGNLRIERKRLENGDSLWIFKQEDGGCWEENFYKDGEIYKKIVFNSDCTKNAEYELKNGKRHGEWKSYHENGKLREKGNYEYGLEKGIFTYYNENEKIIRTENCFIRDSFLVDFWKPFVQKNNYAEFINYLNSQSEKFTVTNNIKVAGNKEYHFPIIKVGKTILEFDLLEKKEPIRCISGELNDCKFMIFGKVCPNKGDGGFLNATGIEWSKGMEYVNIVDLSQLTVYHFKLLDDNIISVSFNPVEFRN